MDHRDSESFLNELAVRVFSGDWRGYRDMVEDGMVNVGDERSVVHLGDDVHRRALSSLSVRIRAAGWDGLKVKATRSTAFGRDLELVQTLSTPMIGDRPAAVPFAEAYLLRHCEAGIRAAALLNPTSERFWQSRGARRRDAAPRGGAGEEISATVTAMHQALHDGNLGAFLRWVDLPLSCFFSTGAVHCKDANGVGDLVRQLRHVSATVASHTVALVDMARFGDALVAARFEARATLRDGRDVDPYHNLYFLRQGPDGWRVTLVASATVAAPTESAGETLITALPHGMNLKDE